MSDEEMNRSSVINKGNMQVGDYNQITYYSDNGCSEHETDCLKCSVSNLSFTISDVQDDMVAGKVENRDNHSQLMHSFSQLSNEVDGLYCRLDDMDRRIDERVLLNKDRQLECETRNSDAAEMVRLTSGNDANRMALGVGGRIARNNPQMNDAVSGRLDAIEVGMWKMNARLDTVADDVIKAVCAMAVDYKYPKIKKKSRKWKRFKQLFRRKSENDNDDSIHPPHSEHLNNGTTMDENIYASCSKDHIENHIDNNLGDDDGFISFGSHDWRILELNSTYNSERQVSEGCYSTHIPHGIDNDDDSYLEINNTGDGNGGYINSNRDTVTSTVENSHFSHNKYIRFHSIYRGSYV